MQSEHSRDRSFKDWLMGTIRVERNEWNKEIASSASAAQRDNDLYHPHSVDFALLRKIIISINENIKRFVILMHISLCMTAISLKRSFIIYLTRPWSLKAVLKSKILPTISCHCLPVSKWTDKLKTVVNCISQQQVVEGNAFALVIALRQIMHLIHIWLKNSSWCIHFSHVVPISHSFVLKQIVHNYSNYKESIMLRCLSAPKNDLL